jgi:hypothetical protein
MDDNFFNISEAEDNVSSLLKEKIVDLEIQRILRVQRNNELFYLDFSVEQSEISDYLLDSHANHTKPQKEIIQVYDSNFNLLGSSRTSDIGNKDGNVRLLSCTSDNVLSCVEDHCEDAGPLLCAGCLVGWKWCLTTLTVICAAEVAFEVERDIYCE